MTLRPAPEDRRIRDGEVIVDVEVAVVAPVPAVVVAVARLLAELAADNDEAVAVGAADHVDRGVDVVDRDDVVVAVVPVAVPVVRRRERVDDEAVVGRVELRSRPDREQVVAGVALQPQGRPVRVDEERVVARAAEDRGREADPAAEPAERRVDGRECVLGRDVRSDARVRVGLADQERVVARAAVERRDRAVVVDREGVVAAEAVDGQPRVDVLVVVDALDVLAQTMEDVVDRAVQERDEGRRLRVLEAEVRRLCRSRRPGASGRRPDRRCR